MDLATKRELDALATAACEVARGREQTGLAELEARYEQLRDRASALNAVHGWARGDEFDTMFPTLGAQRQIDALDALVTSLPRAPADPPAAVRRLVGNLAAWAAGIALTTVVGRERDRS
jgi:hypothetical protein